MNIAVVIPAFNEEQRIVATLRSVRDAGYHQIIVVDDGSADHTSEQARPFATVLRHPINRGMGAALATGTQYALDTGADIIVHFDADGQHQASDIARVIAPLQSGRAAIVFGSRYLGTSKVPWTKKYLLHMPARALQNMTTGLHLSDVHNGFRALDRTAAAAIHISQDRMAHASEIVSEAKRLGLRFEEVPVTISYREYGQGFFGGLRILKDIIVRKLLP